MQAVSAASILASCANGRSQGSRPATHTIRRLANARADESYSRDVNGYSCPPIDDGIALRARRIGFAGADAQRALERR